MIEVGDKIQYYDESIDQLIDDIIIKIDNNIYYLENEYEIEFKNIVKNYTKNEIYHADIKPIHKYDIGTCVYYKDRIYEIAWISNINNNFECQLTGVGTSFKISNQDQLIPTKNDKGKYNIGDNVKYYDQYDDSIHQGIISGFDPDNVYVYFTDNRGTYIDFLGITNKKLRKFDIGNTIKYNNKLYKIIKYYIFDNEFYYELNNNQLIKESMLSPTI